MDKLMDLPPARFFLNKWGPALTPVFVRPTLASVLHRRNLGQIEMGFDAIWAYMDDTWIFLDAKTIALTTGSIFNVISDGYGNLTYMYRGPGITTTEEFDAWPHWPDADAVAQRVYRYYKKLISRHGEKTCIFGYGFFGGLQEAMNWTFGIDRAPLWIRRHPAHVERFLDILEEISIKTHTAMMDAGVRVVLQTDDFAYKTGPFMSPAMVESVFGERYRRIIRNVHGRGAKYVLHSCGDNTRLFDTFIGWGVDGLHAYENTSNVDIYKEKKLHGDRVTIIGGVGIDYLLSERSRDEEIVEKVKELIAKLAPGGRFILGPVHSEDGVPAHKLAVMIEAARTYGARPVSP
jgi:uroporphyrinogen decarboxylase